ncbi:MAG TPA: anthranilate synthase component I [Methanothermococcus okinawensis]|uniref:Anthranilate synthase component 1 n=1 Tax=Methanothermococcus okinawensis TaxID=155863 RepID=A0A832ZCR5_9EURY|nr:anthranilate synthase component I [Methanothermococcus okinawensis]HIP90860.1 anthranilate synthase component I [Methanothermococcus okinawensis]
MKIYRKKFDYVDPIKLYSVLREEGSYPFILESRDKHPSKARYTYISADPEFLVKVKRDTKIDNTRVSRESNPFKGLKEVYLNELEDKTPVNIDENERFIGGFLGYIAYDAIHNYIGGDIEEASVFGYYRSVYVYDHILHRYYYLTLNNSEEEMREAERVVERAKNTQVPGESGGSEVLSCDGDREDYIEMVKRAKEYIYDGDAFQIVLSREYNLRSDMSPFQIYRRLRTISPSPYMFFLEFEKKVLGASPETMASVEKNILKINPIAGTINVGRTEEETKKLAEKLLQDEKERAEHMMLVDLARNDVRKVSKPGSVKLKRFLEVVRYSHVQHIESEVIGELREDITMFDAVEASFPAGTLTGAPKYRAMEIIDSLERSRRGVYGGAVGYFSLNNYGDTAIAIRMAEIERNNLIKVRAGAGIVADSIPEKEYLETERKMAAIMSALNVKG